MKQVSVIAASIALTACAAVGPPYPPPPPPPPPPIVWGNASATVGFGGQAMLNNIRIRPLAVIEDSRCAINVQCVWAGRLVLSVEIVQRGGSEELRTNMTLGQPLPIEGGRLTLVAAHPPKIAGPIASPPASSFTLELTR
jgi:hypothetical protein